MDELLQDLITEELLHQGTSAMALAQFLANKGIIDLDEFLKFREDFARHLIEEKYPTVFQKEL